MNGNQLSGTTCGAASAMKSRTTETLITTMTLLTLADSRIPITSSAVTSATISTAGRLKIAVTVEPSASVTTWPRAAVSWGGITMPKSRRKETTYPDQPMETVTAPSAYSRIRSHPMIQAKNSPRVA
jgi:hypothetical protein